MTDLFEDEYMEPTADDMNDIPSPCRSLRRMVHHVEESPPHLLLPDNQLGMPEYEMAIPARCLSIFIDLAMK